MGNMCMLGWRKVSVEDRRGDCGEDPGDDEDLLLLLLIYVVYIYIYMKESWDVADKVSYVPLTGLEIPL